MQTTTELIKSLINYFRPIRSELDLSGFYPYLEKFYFI